MATITTINSSDQITNSRSTINTNFTNLNSDKIETSVLDTDTTLAANSDSKIATQKATKAYVDTRILQDASEVLEGAVEEATDAETSAGTATGGTGAKLFVTPAKLATLLASFIPTEVVASTCFETSGRFTAILNGSGANTFNTSGLTIDTTAAGTSAAGVTLLLGNTSLFTASPRFGIRLHIVAKGTTADSFFGIGTVTKTGSGHTYTTDHAGFKLVTVGSVMSLYATQGNGTTETASSALTTVAATDTLELKLKINSTTSIDYYYCLNGGAWSSATNLTTNMPDTLSNILQFSVSNQGIASQTSLALYSANYSR